MLAACQEAVLQKKKKKKAGLEICCEPHLHPHIHSVEFISIASGERGVEEGGVREKNGDGGGEEEVHCTAVQHKKAHEKCVSVRVRECAGVGGGERSRRKCETSSLLRVCASSTSAAPLLGQPLVLPRLISLAPSQIFKRKGKRKRRRRRNTRKDLLLRLAGRSGEGEAGGGRGTFSPRDSRFTTFHSRDPGMSC